MMGRWWSSNGSNGHRGIAGSSPRDPARTRNGKVMMGRWWSSYDSNGHRGIAGSSPRDPARTRNGTVMMGRWWSSNGSNGHRGIAGSSPRDPARTRNATEVANNFSKGNTTLYLTKLPENGEEIIESNKRDWKKGNAYKIDVKYDITVKVVDNLTSSKPSDTPSPDGLISSVLTKKSPFSDEGINKGSSIGAKSGYQDGENTQVLLNPGFKDYLSPEDVITHEVGFHNMEQKAHTTLDMDGNVIYPTSGLESNVPGTIYPSEEDTKNIINANLKSNRLDYESK